MILPPTHTHNHIYFPIYNQHLQIPMKGNVSIWGSGVHLTAKLVRVHCLFQWSRVRLSPWLRVFLDCFSSYLYTLGFPPDPASWLPHTKHMDPHSKTPLRRGSELPAVCLRASGCWFSPAMVLTLDLLNVEPQLWGKLPVKPVLLPLIPLLCHSPLVPADLSSIPPFSQAIELFL